MARKKGMMGPGSMKMGGAGIKPGAAPTPMAGRSPMGAPGGMPSLGGGAPGGMPRPPMGGAGGPAPGGQPVARSPAGGMGGAAGFNKGGEAEKKRHRHEKLAHGGPVGADREERGESKREEREEERKGFAKGGIVHGSDTKARVRAGKGHC